MAVLEGCWVVDVPLLGQSPSDFAIAFGTVLDVYQEITALIEILGLKFNTEYTNAKSLRYGHVMVMADQDHDGSHIKGLVLNFLHAYWPSLFRIPGFLCEFITPIVKCTKGTKVVSFYTMPEYMNWAKVRCGGHTVCVILAV